MKVSLNWIQEFVALDKSPEKIAEILTSIGLEVEGWETKRSWKIADNRSNSDSKNAQSIVSWDKVVIGNVVFCTHIEGTDHLSATKVNIGDGAERSVVCGAPNVAIGQKVLLALPGATVFSKDGTAFEIGERKVRGVLSQGMICAEDELGLGHDHSGIMVLPIDTPLGVSGAFLEKEEDVIFEIGLTPNRADATNHIGVARDLAAWLAVHEGQTAAFNTPEIAGFSENTSQPFAVKVDNPEACLRYCGVLIKNMQPSPHTPDWIKKRLIAVGQGVKNNLLIDITNYIRLEMGQPLHAFDAKAIGGGGIRVGTVAENTPFRTFNDTEIKLNAADLMICDAAGTPMCIGGVVGDSASGVKPETADIFLESACFHPQWIRRSMVRHNLRTDAAWTFEKGVDPNGCKRALERAVQLLTSIAGGEIASAIIDIYPKPVAPARIAVQWSHINDLIGYAIPVARIKAILSAMDIALVDETEVGFTAVVPTNKPDVTREADIVEEILRIFGLDNVPVPEQIRASMEIATRPTPDQVRNTAADFLAANGLHECMSLSLTNSAYFTEALQIDREHLVFVHNTANQGLDCLRPTMLFSGLETIRNNQNRQNPNLRLFEFGKIYFRKPDHSEKGVEGFSEYARLAICLTGAYQSESWHPAAKKEVDIFTLKAVVDNLLTRLGISGFQVSSTDQKTFYQGLKYHRGPVELVSFGRVAPDILKKTDVKNDVFFADFDWAQVLKAAAGKIKFQELNKFPAARRDLALILDTHIAFEAVQKLGFKTEPKLLKTVNLFDIFEDETKIGVGKKSYAVSFVFENTEKTLQDKDIDAAMQLLMDAFEQKLGAQIRK